MDFIKSIISLLIILSFSLSCKEQLNGEKFYLGYRNNSDILYKLIFNNDSITGEVVYLGKYLDSITPLPLKGTIKNTEVIWTSYQYGDKRFLSSGQINSNNELSISRSLIRDSLEIDSVFLKQINIETYNQKIKEALFPPKLITLKKDTTINNFLFELKVENWNPKTFYGNTTLKIKDKTSKKLIQTLSSDNFWFNENLYFGYETDYNFDTITDLSFYNGDNGGYSTMTFDYYLFDKEKELFIRNKQLEEIARGMGIEVDASNKRIISYFKSGCCTHLTEAYSVNKNKYTLIKSLLVDELNNNIVIKDKVREKWKTIKKPFSTFTNEQIDSLYNEF